MNNKVCRIHHISYVSLILLVVVVVVDEDVDTFIKTTTTATTVIITANIKPITIAFPLVDARKDVDLSYKSMDSIDDRSHQADSLLTRR